MFRSLSTRLSFAATSVMLAQTGKITSFNRQKGFGFVEEGEGDSKKSHFVHFSALQCEGGFKAVDVGTTVEFDVAPDERDPSRTRAINVCMPGGKPIPAPQRREFEGGDRGGDRGGNFRGGDRGGDFRGRGRGNGGGFRGRGRGGDRDNRRNEPQDDF